MNDVLNAATEVLIAKSVWFITAGAGILGRMMYHSKEVQSGRRKRFFSRDLFLELIIALGMGFMARGLCEYFAVYGDIEIAVVILVSYLGPNGVNAAFEVWLKKQKEKTGE